MTNSITILGFKSFLKVMKQEEATPPRDSRSFSRYSGSLLCLRNRYRDTKIRRNNA